MYTKWRQESVIIPPYGEAYKEDFFGVSKRLAYNERSNTETSLFNSCEINFDTFYTLGITNRLATSKRLPFRGYKSFRV